MRTAPCIHQRGEAGFFLQDSLGRVGIVPEIGPVGLLIKAGYFFIFFVDVKDSP
jgi:hypothetical protein